VATATPAPTTDGGGGDIVPPPGDQFCPPGKKCK
jgi:hypothetical protein